jgi:Tfp pilus assembly protein PilX
MIATLRRSLRAAADESGIALIFAILVTTALAAIVTSVILFSSSSARTSHRSSAQQNAYQLAESGIASAMSVLKLTTNNALDPTIFCTSPSQPTPCTTTETYGTGTVTWFGVLNQATWTLTSTGSVPNPTGPGTAPVTRKITATVTVHPTLTQPLNTPVWNYMYATKPASPVPTCDMTIGNSVVVNSPLYVEGNLCLTQSAAITKGPLVVKGRLSLANKRTSGNPGNYVGQAAAPISEVHVLNGCNYNGTLFSTPCPNNGTANIWSTLAPDGSVPNDLNPPQVDFNKWYLNGSPGPYYGCQTIDGLPPIAGYPGFDTPTAAMTASDATKLTYKNNNMGNQNLTPGTSYRCQTTSGELSWDATSRILTIRGTIYVDGSLYVSNGLLNQYRGQGVIYVSGTFLNTGSGLCGAVRNGACDNSAPGGTCTNPTGGWDPNCNLLVIVAQGTGGQVSSGDSIQFTTTSDTQAAVYATGNVDIGQSSKFAGPIVGASIILGQSVSTNFPNIATVPNGMPSNPTAYANADPPVYG